MDFAGGEPLELVIGVAGCVFLDEGVGLGCVELLVEEGDC